jgi:hypothetical protein
MFLGKIGGYSKGKANGVDGRKFKHRVKWYKDKNKMTTVGRGKCDGERSIRQWADSLRRKTCNIWSRY